MLPPQLGILLTPGENVLLLLSGSAEATLHLPGYRDRLDQLLAGCLAGRLPVSLSGPLPVFPSSLELLAKFPASGLPLFGDREFRGVLRRLYPEASPALAPSTEAPAGAYVLAAQAVFHDPIWQIFEELAIPLPRRIVCAVEDPFFERPPGPAFAGDWFDLFLDSGGHPLDLVLKAGYPHQEMITGMLYRLFPQAWFLDSTAASLFGALSRMREDGVEIPPCWMLIHSGEEFTTVLALKRKTILAGFRHRTKQLTAPKLCDFIVQLGRGIHLEQEILLDGGLFAATRLLPEEEGPWTPWILTGPAAPGFADLPAQRENMRPENRPAELCGLRYLLERLRG